MKNLNIGHLEQKDHVNLETLADSQKLGWQINSYKFPEIWKETKGENVKVAVLDTAVDINHPDLNIKGGYDFVNDNELSTSIPAHGHGTHVCGIIGASDNDKGIIGVAPDCELYSCVVLGDDGSGSYSWIMNALDWCIENKMDVINMSLGGGGDFEEFYDKVRKVYDVNIPIVAAAGNSNWETGYLDFPATYNETIAVASINKYMERSSFSSIGSNIDIAAPGSDILSTTPDNSYSIYSGTSMATPFVTGLIALMIAKHRTQESNTPINNVEDVRKHLIKTAKDTDFEGQDSYTGYGLINPFGIINYEDAESSDEYDITYEKLMKSLKVKFNNDKKLSGHDWKELFWGLGMKSLLNDLDIQAGDIEEIELSDLDIRRAIIKS